MTFKYCPQCGKKLGTASCGDDGETPWCDSCRRPFFPFSYPCVICLCVTEEGGELVLIKQSYVSEHYVNVAGYIKEGETLMVMGDKTKGIALVKADSFYTLFGGANNGGNKDR